MQLNGKNHGSYIGHPTVQNTPVSNCLCQENLTKSLKKIINRDTYINLSNMGKFNKIGTGLAAAAAMAMTPGGANAELAEASKPLETTLTTGSQGGKITREQCRAFAEKTEKIACYKRLKVQGDTELAALDNRIAEQRAEIANRSDRIASKKVDSDAKRDHRNQQVETITVEQAGLEKDNTTLRGLTKVAAMQENPNRE